MDTRSWPIPKDLRIRGKFTVQAFTARQTQTLSRTVQGKEISGPRGKLGQHDKYCGERTQKSVSNNDRKKTPKILLREAA